MKDLIIDYLLQNTPFSFNECECIANEIDIYDSIAYIQDVLLKYMGGEDDYAYETTYEIAREIKNL